jgi:hypothetical protein
MLPILITKTGECIMKRNGIHEPDHKVKASNMDFERMGKHTHHRPLVIWVNIPLKKKTFYIDG